MQKVYKYVVLMSTVPALYELYKENANELDDDEKEWAIDKECNFVCVNVRDGLSCKNVPKLITLLPFRNDVIIGCDQFQDAVGKNDSQGEISPRSFTIKNKKELKEIAGRFNTLASGAVNPMIDSWIKSIEFDTLAQKFLEDGVSSDKLDDKAMRILLRREEGGK